MYWTFENFNPRLQALAPEVRKKALAIARQLMKKGEISEERALKQAIVRAEEWLYNSEG